MQLKNIINHHTPHSNPHIAQSNRLSAYYSNEQPYPKSQSKITHELNNQGCKCTLCQKVTLKQNNIIKHVEIKDQQSELCKGSKSEFFNDFLQQFYYIDKINRKIRIILPEMCIFEKGQPVCLLTKKKDILPMKMIKNKQKMNAFEIQNFFMEGYIYHNNLKENEEIMKNHKVKTLKKQYYKFDEYLKNQCIVLVKFIDGTCQMMTPTQLSNLFKSKQKNVRLQIRDITTMVCNNNYQQLRVHIDLDELDSNTYKDALFERAKNEVKMINENIKPKDFMFIPEREEKKFEEELKKKDEKEYLKYLGLKMLLIFSIKTDVLLKKCLFKFMKDENDNYYLVDLQSYAKTTASRLWGEFEKKILESPKKPSVKRRPVSSPEKLQSRKTKTEDNINQEAVQEEMKKIFVDIKEDSNDFFMQHNFCQIRDNQNAVKKIQSRVKTNSLLKLEPITKTSYRNRRLISNIVSQNKPKIPLMRYI